MTDAIDTKPADDIPDINAAMPGLLPVLRNATIQGWLMAAGVLAGSAALAWAVSGLGEDGKAWAFAILFMSLFGMGAVARYTRRRHEAEIMPLLARTAGLDYAQQGKWFLDSLPPRLLPKDRDRTCEDALSGKIGDRPIRFAEAKIETGGKNSTTLFRGVVAEFPNVVPMPAFFVASEAQTRGWFIFKGNIQVDDLVRVQTLSGRSGMEYGVWSSSAEAARKPGFEAVLDILTGLESIVGSDAKLYTASSDGVMMHLAISSKRDLFKIGGMFASADTLAADIRRAYDDLTLPMKIVSALLQAEGAVAKAASASPA